MGQKMEVEMIDVGVFGSGESEVVVLVGDDDGKGDSLQKGIKKVTRETIKQLGNDLLGSDGALVQPAQITDFPLGTRTPYAKASAPRMLHVSCLSVHQPHRLSQFGVVNDKWLFHNGTG